MKTIRLAPIFQPRLKVRTIQISISTLQLGNYKQIFPDIGIPDIFQPMAINCHYMRR
jgi:hypothetical protein